MSKRFSQDLYNQSDHKSKQLVYRFLRDQFPKYELIPIESQEEAYKSHDLRVIDTTTNTDVLIEVEQKVVWAKRGQWEGWDTVDIPYRKNKSKARFFFMVNKWFDTLLVIRMKTILESPVIKKSTIYTTDEEFFSVPIRKFKLVHLPQ
jgi:hypothetical protein